MGDIVKRYKEKVYIHPLYAFWYIRRYGYYEIGTGMECNRTTFDQFQWYYLCWPHWSDCKLEDQPGLEDVG